MIEKIYVYLCLLRVGFIDNSAYNEELDKLFMQNPESDLLLELEFLSSDIEKSWNFLHQYCIGDNHISYDYLQFGKVLFSYLEEVYNSNQMELRAFAKKSV